VNNTRRRQQDFTDVILICDCGECPLYQFLYVTVENVRRTNSYMWLWRMSAVPILICDCGECPLYQFLYVTVENVRCTSSYMWLWRMSAVPILICDCGECPLYQSGNTIRLLTLSLLTTTYLAPGLNKAFKKDDPKLVKRVLTGSLYSTSTFIRRSSNTISCTCSMISGVVALFGRHSRGCLREMYQLRKKIFADIIAVYGRGWELFRPLTYIR
jgi:hypothetical protein